MLERSRPSKEETYKQAAVSLFQQAFTEASTMDTPHNQSLFTSIQSVEQQSNNRPDENAQLVIYQNRSRGAGSVNASPTS